jgi:hypothetical protein
MDIKEFMKQNNGSRLSYSGRWMVVETDGIIDICTVYEHMYGKPVKELGDYPLIARVASKLQNIELPTHIHYTLVKTARGIKCRNSSLVLSHLLSWQYLGLESL